jgi:hypothetical protein
MLSFSCPQCGNTLQVPETHPGTLVVCPRCQRQVTAPTTALQSAPSPPARAGFASAPPPAAAARSSSNLVPILLIGGGVAALVLFLLCGGLVVGGILYARARAKTAAVAWAEEEMRFVEGQGVVEVRDELAPRLEPVDFINRVHVQFNEGQRFGLVCPRLRDPRNPEVLKKLTRDDRGATNNTAVRIEGYEYIFGVEIPGTHYVKDKGKLMREVPIPGKDKDRAWQTAWETDFGRIRITQSVELLVGEQTRVYDTVLVKYHVWNRDRIPHQVGLRVMLDTFVGGTDGVPFYIPPTANKPARFVDKMEVFPDIPDFVQALESADLNDSNAALALVGLKVKGMEPLEKLVICRWPQNSEARWGGGNGPGDWAYEPMDKNPNIKDSCVVLYWTQANMRPDEHRDLAFTYGLGRVPSDIARDGDVKVAGGGKMRLFVPQASSKKPFVATAYVKAGNANQTVTLKLPAGLQFAAGQSAQQPVPPANSAGYSQVTWKLNATRSGTFVIEAEGPGLGVATEKVTVGEASLFDG